MNAKPVIDLEQARPEQIEDDASPLDLAEAVEALPAWSVRGLKVVNEVLTNWVADAIGRPNDHDGLIDLQSAIERIRYAAASRSAGLAQRGSTEAVGFGDRWGALSDAIAARHIVLAERAPERIRGLSHVAKIEELLKQGELKQSELEAGVGLKPSRLSQVLSLMEAHGLIERRSSGKEKLVRLARSAVAIEPAIVRPATNACRGTSYLSLLKAA